jgi:hypothetical protein
MKRWPIIRHARYVFWLAVASLYERRFYRGPAGDQTMFRWHQNGILAAIWHGRV